MKYVLIVASFAVAFSWSPGATADAKPAEEPLPGYDRFDLSNAVRHDYVFTIPATADEYAVTVDWATGRVALAEPSPLATGPMAGCASAGAGASAPAPWAREPIAVNECGHQFHHWAFSSTTHICAVAPLGRCYTDGINFSFINFSYFFITCDPPVGVMHVDWASYGITNLSCGFFTYALGGPPTTWTFWDSICAGSPTVRAGACFHASDGPAA